MPPSTLLIGLLARVLRDVLAPLIVASLLVVFLTDPARVDTSELVRNSLLMNTRPIFRVVSPLDAIVNSAILLATALAAAIAVGVPFGIAYASSNNRPVRALAWSASTFAASLPAFFWAIALELLMVVIYFRFGLRLLPITGFGIDEHLILPALALALRPAAYIFRLTATAVEQIRHTDYVRTAIAKGLPDRTLLARHVLPNAAPNIIAATLLGARGALSSLVIVEFVYIWDGAGLAFVQALGGRQFALASAIALAFAVGSTMLVLGGELARSRVKAAP
ncbi:MAG TPA: ABC transporter permease subunit [Candidatus Limnocylindria bacterium]|nr:ABC transporter permease subunit [Candidatus Limnocylindria bacterium]